MIDANCCIKAVLEVKGVKDYYKDAINEFINKCTLNEILVGYFPIIREMSERNLPKALNELFRQRNVKLREYHYYKALDRVRIKLKKLFDEKLTELDQSCSDNELSYCRAFFGQIKKRLSTKTPKNPVPEDEDIIILISTTKQPWERKGILSDDSHFTDYKEEIYDQYKIEILPMKDLNQIMISWKWK